MAQQSTLQDFGSPALQVPTVNLSSVGSVVRCKRCRTYINPSAADLKSSGRLENETSVHRIRSVYHVRSMLRIQ